MPRCVSVRPTHAGEVGKVMDTPITPDTDVPLSVEEMAAAFDRLGESAGEDVELSVDVDDYPLFAFMSPSGG